MRDNLLSHTKSGRSYSDLNLKRSYRDKKITIKFLIEFLENFIKKNTKTELIVKFK